MTTVINSLVQGDDYPWSIVVKDGIGQGVNIVGWVLHINIMTNKNDLLSAAQVAWSYTFPNDSNTQVGIGSFVFPSTETSKLVPGYAWLSMKMEMTTLSPAIKKTFMVPRRITVVENMDAD